VPHRKGARFSPIGSVMHRYHLWSMTIEPLNLRFMQQMGITVAWKTRCNQLKRRTRREQFYSFGRNNVNGSDAIYSLVKNW
jgi:hypothetical protein